MNLEFLLSLGITAPLLYLPVLWDKPYPTEEKAVLTAAFLLPAALLLTVGGSGTRRWTCILLAAAAAFVGLSRAIL